MSCSNSLLCKTLFHFPWISLSLSLTFKVSFYGSTHFTDSQLALSSLYLKPRKSDVGGEHLLIDGVFGQGMGWVSLFLGQFHFWVLFFYFFYFLYNTINFLGSFKKSLIFFFLSFSRRVLKLRANYICFKYKFYIVRGQIQKFEGKRGWGRARRL